MDRNRLKEVHTSDLSESRVNEDFVTWLKNSGPTYFLIVLIFLLGAVAWVRWDEKKENDTKVAWAAFASSQLPNALADIAVEYDGVGALPLVARLTAAEILMRAVQSNLALNADGQTPTPLTDEDRTNYLQRADTQYQTVIDSDDKSDEKTIFMVSAYNGRAAVAESRGDLEVAREMYDLAANRAGDIYPFLAAQSRHRSDTVEVASEPVTLIKSADVPLAPALNNFDRTPLFIESTFLDAISPSNF